MLSNRLAPAAEKRRSKEVVPFDMLQWSLEDLRSPKSKKIITADQKATKQPKEQKAERKKSKTQKLPIPKEHSEDRKDSTKTNGTDHTATMMQKKKKKDRTAPAAAKRARKEIVPFDMLQWSLEDSARISTPKSKAISNGTTKKSAPSKHPSSNGKAKGSPARKSSKRSEDESDKTPHEDSDNVSEGDPSQTDAALYVKMVTTARAPHKRKIKAGDVAPLVGPDVGVDTAWLFSANDEADDSEFDESDVEDF